MGWLLASDYAYAGLVGMPDSAEVGEIIFRIDAGGRGGLRLIGFSVDTKEECAAAMLALWDLAQRFLTPAEIEEMGLDPIVLEHALCKFKRLSKCIAEVSEVLWWL